MMSRKPNGTNETNVANGTNTRIEKTIAKPAGAGDVPFQPVYFLSLEVENFRCFGPKQTLNLATKDGRPARWTVILGENGVGKTTLLRRFANFQPVKGELTHKEPTSFYSEPRCSSGVSLAALFDRNDIYRPESNSKFSLSADYSLGYLEEQKRSGSGTLYLTIEGHHATVRAGDITLSNMVCFGYGASRRMGKSNLSDKRDDDNCASLFDDDAELLNAEEWLLQADYAASRKSPRQRQAVKQRDRVKEILTALLPDVKDIRIAEGEGSFSVPYVEFQTPYGWVRLQNLSLGYRALITWMVDLASRLFDHYPNSDDPLAQPAVVLVDEIDLHLHPRWQRTLMQFLSGIFKNTQFIVTAHSPLVVQAADEDANIVLLRREGDHVVIENDKETIRGWRVDQILTSELFGLATARPPQYEAAIDERTALLSKGKMTKADEARVAELDKIMGELPTGETASDREAMDIIRRAAELLKTK